jgi:gliding motility-associated-like protein
MFTLIGIFVFLKNLSTLRSLAFYLSPVLLLFVSANIFGQTRETVTSVTVKDVTPCSCDLGMAVTSLNNATSCDSKNGSIAINITGGSGNYSFSWSDQSGLEIGTTKDLLNLLPGFYFLKATDNNKPSCSVQGYFEIGLDVSITFAVLPNVSCVLPTGSIGVSVSGGSGSFSYEWTFPDGTKVSQQNLVGLKGGQYLLKVTDLVKGCTVSKSVTVKNPTNLMVTTLTAQDNTSCVSPNGGVSVSISGGSGDYKYFWYDVNNGFYVSYNKDLSLVKGGRYSLYVVDQISGCVVYQFFDILDQVNAPTYTYSVEPNTNCSAPFNGSVDLLPSGSPGPYSIAWTDGSKTVSNAEDPTGLPPGRYGFAITDNTTGCSTTVGVNDVDAVVIGDESLPSMDVTVDGVSDNTDCNQPDGTIQISVQTENPYTFYWTGPNGFTSNDEDLTNLPGGTYQFHALASCVAGDNRPPVISQNPIFQPLNTPMALNLLDIITDPDGNLDESSIQVVENPTSGVQWTLSPDRLLTVSYQGTDFSGNDRIKVSACDLLNACTEGYITINVNSGDIIVYNAVAPHSIGDNKFMRILNLPEVNNKVSIYNRWGDKVYEVNNYDSYFAGKRFEGRAQSGNELPSGTYFYKIEFADGRKTMTGYLALRQ